MENDKKENQKEDINSEYCTINDICKKYNMGVRAAQTLCSMKNFPVIRIGRRILIHKRLLEEWENENIGKAVEIKSGSDSEESPKGIKLSSSFITSDSDYFTLSDICDILDIGRSNATNLIHTEGFPSILVGNRNRINKQKFFEWISEHLENNDTEEMRKVKQNRKKRGRKPDPNKKKKL